jgi:hypothetical protein
MGVNQFYVCCTNFRSSVKAKAIYLICGFHVNNSF